jgi:hypothetical protein
MRVEDEGVESRILGDGGVEVEQRPAGRERVANRAVERSLGTKVMHVVQCQGGDDGVRGGQRVQEAAVLNATGSANEASLRRTARVLVEADPVSR